MITQFLKGAAKAVAAFGVVLLAPVLSKWFGMDLGIDTDALVELGKTALSSSLDALIAGAAVYFIPNR